MFKLTIQNCNKSPRPFVMSRDRGRLGLTDTKYHEPYQMAGFYPGLSNLISSAGGLCRRFACPEKWRRSSTPKTPAARPPALPGIAECAFGASAGQELVSRLLLAARPLLLSRPVERRGLLLLLLVRSLFLPGFLVRGLLGFPFHRAHGFHAFRSEEHTSELQS